MGILKRTNKLLVALTTAIICMDGFAGTSAMLTWKIPTTRENGEALSLSDLKGYEIYYTTEDLSKADIVPVDGASTSSYILKNLAAGKYYIAISAIDVSGLKSKLSATVPFIINPAAPPNTPTAVSTTSSASTSAGARTLAVSWVAPSTRADGSALPLNEVSGYSIDILGMYSSAAKASVSGGSSKTYYFNNMKIGQYVVAIAAIGKDGQKSKNAYKLITVQ